MVATRLMLVLVVLILGCLIAKMPLALRAVVVLLGLVMLAQCLVIVECPIAYLASKFEIGVCANVPRSASILLNALLSYLVHPYGIGHFPRVVSHSFA